MSNHLLEAKLIVGTYSNTLESFWSPHMRISAMERNVSTIVCLLFSVTCGFRSNTIYWYLKVATEGTKNWSGMHLQQRTLISAHQFAAFLHAGLPTPP